MMNKKNDKYLFIFLLLVPFIITHTQSQFPFLDGEYLGQNVPGLKAELFAPGIISTELHDDAAPVFSPDGKEIYFRIVYKFEDTFYSSIFLMKEVKGKWTKPELTSFSGKYLDGGVTFIDSLKLLFFSNRGYENNNKYDSNFWIISKNGGKWDFPKKLINLNSPYTEIYPIFYDNNKFFWTVEKSMNDDKPKTYSADYDGDDFINKKESNLFPNINKTVYVWDISDDGNFVLLSMDVPEKGLDLFVSFKLDGFYGKPKNLGEDVNSKFMEKDAKISPDGKYIFFVSNRKTMGSNPKKLWNSELLNENSSGFGADIYWVSTEVIDLLRD